MCNEDSFSYQTLNNMNAWRERSRMYLTYPGDKVRNQIQSLLWSLKQTLHTDSYNIYIIYWELYNICDLAIQDKWYLYARLNLTRREDVIVEPIVFDDLGLENFSISILSI